MSTAFGVDSFHTGCIQPFEAALAMAAPAAFGLVVVHLDSSEAECIRVHPRPRRLHLAVLGLAC